MNDSIMYLVVYDLPDGLYDVVIVFEKEALEVFRGILYKQLQGIVNRLNDNGVNWYMIHR